jgi:hypothetical protein
MALLKLPNGLYRGITLGMMLPKTWKGGASFPSKPKIEGKSHVFELQNGFFFFSMARDDEKVLFHGVRVMKHKCDT